MTSPDFASLLLPQALICRCRSSAATWSTTTIPLALPPSPLLQHHEVCSRGNYTRIIIFSLIVVFNRCLTYTSDCFPPENYFLLPPPSLSQCPPLRSKDLHSEFVAGTIASAGRSTETHLRNTPVVHKFICTPSEQLDGHIDCHDERPSRR